MSYGYCSICATCSISGTSGRNTYKYNDMICLITIDHYFVEKYILETISIFGYENTYQKIEIATCAIFDTT